MGRIFASVFGAMIFVVVTLIVFGSWYTIDQGERGVLLRNGAYVGIAEPGLGFKTPWIEDVVEVSVQSHKRIYGGESVFEAYSRDQQPANMRLSVNYRIPADQVDDVYISYGGEEGVVTRLLDPHVYEKAKTVFGRFNAATAIQERGRLNQEVTQAIAESTKGPIIVETVQIEDISFDETYEQAIRDRMQAEVEVQKLQQNAEREIVQAQIAVTQANARADAVRAEAQAQADATRLTGNATADAIRARAAALGQNPLLIQLTQAEKWNGQLPSTMVPGGAVPFIDVPFVNVK